jgi:hypothetical protein
MPTLKDLQELLRKATCTLSGIHIIGHGDSKGLYFVSRDNRKQPARVEASNLKEMIRNVPSIEFVVLNACDTELLGRDLKEDGVKHVVCWRGKVADVVAETFSSSFYQTLNDFPGDYCRAFAEGRVAVRLLQGEKLYAGDRMPFGEPCYLCDSAAHNMLPDEDTEQTHKEVSEDEEESFPPQHLPAKEQEQEDNSEDDGENRSMNNIKGEKERRALEELGFVLRYRGYSIEAGIRLYQKGTTVVDVGQYGLRQHSLPNGHTLLYLTTDAVQRIFGPSVSSYTDSKLWNHAGPICKKAETILPLSKLSRAIDLLKESLAKRPPTTDSGHAHMRKNLTDCVDALKEINKRRNLSAAAPASAAASAPAPVSASGADTAASFARLRLS